MSTAKQEPRMLPLVEALTEWEDMQALVGEHVILVRDFNCYQGGGVVVKINNEEPAGIHNAYSSADEIERDLVRVVPTYIKGAPIWQEGEYDY